jgi:hypothetical protein
MAQARRAPKRVCFQQVHENVVTSSIFYSAFGTIYDIWSQERDPELYRQRLQTKASELGFTLPVTVETRDAYIEDQGLLSCCFCLLLTIAFKRLIPSLLCSLVS